MEPEMNDSKPSETLKTEKRSSARLILQHYLRLMASTLPMPSSVSYTSLTFEGYWISLSDDISEPEQMEWALTRCLKECAFFPSAHEIREFCREWVPAEERRQTSEAVRRTMDASRSGTLTREAAKETVQHAIEEMNREDALLEARYAEWKSERKELTPAEFEARMAELERQKQEMMRQHLAAEGKR